MALMALEFVADVVAAPDPNRGNSAGITVAEALDNASARLDAGDLGSSLEAQARIRRMLGSTYMAMGLYDKARPQLERSLDLAQRAFGASSEQAGSAWNDLGELNRMSGDFAAAESNYTQALRVQSRLPRSIATAQTYNNLGLLKQAIGKYDEALDLQRKSLDMRLALLGINDPEVATSYNNLGALCMSMGDFTAAEDYYRRALAMRLRLLSPGHWRVASTQINLARTLLERHELAEADQLATAALASARVALGDSHTLVGRAVFCLALVRQEQGRAGEAEQLFRSSLQIQRDALPAEHPEIAHSLSGLGAFLVEQRRFAEAAPVLREALQIRQSKLAPDHPLVGVALSALGEAILGEGRPDDAGPLLNDGYRILSTRKHVAESELRRATLRLAALAHARGDPAAEQRWTAAADELK
jgi:tetratricopeptide (TPR) repeat protein